MLVESAHVAGQTNPLAAISTAERHYPGGDLLTHGVLARQHAAYVAMWLGTLARNAGSKPPYNVATLAASIQITTHALPQAARSPIALHDGAGVVVLPAHMVLVDPTYPLFTEQGVRRHAPASTQPLNPLVAFRWSLTDLLLRLNAPNAPVTFAVADDSGAFVPIPYSHGFAMGSGALYTHTYPYAPPNVNLGFDLAALKVLAALCSAESGLSYMADVTMMPHIAGYLDDLRAVLEANRVTQAVWQGLYQTSAVLQAVLALIQHSHRLFGQDPDPSHLGQNVARTAYGYAIMKAISQNNRPAFATILHDFTLPPRRHIPQIIAR